MGADAQCTEIDVVDTQQADLAGAQAVSVRDQEQRPVARRFARVAENRRASSSRVRNLMVSVGDRAIALAYAKPELPEITVLSSSTDPVSSALRQNRPCHDRRLHCNEQLCRPHAENLLSRSPHPPKWRLVTRLLGLGLLDHDEVEATNNRAERQLRPAVISRKISCGNKTEEGMKTWEILASLAATCQQKGLSFIDHVAQKMPLAASPQHGLQ